MGELAGLILSSDGATAVELRAGLQAGAGAVMGVLHPEQRRILAQLRREFTFDIYPLVPDAPAYVRDMADLGLIGTALKRVRRLRPAAWVQLARYGLKQAAGVLASDFATMLGVTVQMELPAYARLRPPLVFLHPQMTDLLLACGNTGGYRAFAALVRGAGARPGLATRNFGHLVPLLARADAGIEVIAAPFNPLGAGMRPNAAACERLLAGRDWQVVADDPTAAGAVDPAQARAYAKRHGFAGVAVPQGSGWERING